MCKGKAKAARREPNGKYFGQNEPFFSLPFFAEIAGKDAYLVIFFRKYTNCIKICRRIEAAQSVISRPAIQIKILLRMVCQTAGKTNELCAQARCPGRRGAELSDTNTIGRQALPGGPAIRRSAAAAAKKCRLALWPSRHAHTRSNRMSCPILSGSQG